MTRKELVSRMADDAQITQKAADAALESFLSSVYDTLGKGESVSLVGFGTFGVSKRAAREGRNPQTGASIKIPERNVPRFKPGKKLKDSVN